MQGCLLYKDKETINKTLDATPSKEHISNFIKIYKCIYNKYLYLGLKSLISNPRHVQCFGVAAVVWY